MSEARQGSNGIKAMREGAGLGHQGDSRREYYAPHLAHATMEPPAALARRDGDNWDIWAPVQSPGRHARGCGQALGVADVKSRCTRRCSAAASAASRNADYAIEAALLSKELDGAPVKVVWSREDDIRHGFYHTVTADRFEAGLDAANKVVAWRHRSAAPSFMANFVPDPKHPSGIELGMGWVDVPFNVPNMRMESGEAAAQVRIGWFRSVNNVMHAWSVPVVHRRTRRAAQPRPEGLPARDDRTGAHRRSAQTSDDRALGLRRAVRDLSDRHRQAASRRGACSRAGRMGQAAPEGPRARHRGASLGSSPTSRPWSRSRSTRRAITRAARRHRDRLRLLRQP